MKTRTLEKISDPFLSLGNILILIFSTALAVSLSPLFHILNLPVFAILPMHFLIFLMSFGFGWKNGLFLGLVAPLISFLTTGMPVLPIMILMTIELASYGFFADFIAQSLNKKTGKFTLFYSFFSVFVALFAGKFLYLVGFAIISKSYAVFSLIKTAFAAGIISISVQLVLFSFLFFLKYKNSNG